MVRRTERRVRMTTVVLGKSYLDHPGYIPTFRQLTEASRRWFPKQRQGLRTHETGADNFWTYWSTRTREDTQRHRRWTTVADRGTHKQLEPANNERREGNRPIEVDNVRRS